MVKMGARQREDGSWWVVEVEGRRRRLAGVSDGPYETRNEAEVAARKIEHAEG